MSNADKLEVRAALLRGQSFRDAVQALAGLDPNYPIQKLHTRTVKSGGSYLGEIGAFLHLVVHGEEARAELLERLKGWPAKWSVLEELKIPITDRPWRHDVRDRSGRRH